MGPAPRPRADHAIDRHDRLARWTRRCAGASGPRPGHPSSRAPSPCSRRSTPTTRALGLADLARRTGIPLSTTFRLAGHLLAWGALEKDPDERYVVGLRLFEIASLAPRSHGLREVALPYLEDLHEVSGQHVLLAVRESDEALLVERLSSRGAVEIDYRVGGRMPLHDTGVGLVLLAGAPAPVAARVLDRLDPPAADRVRGRLEDVRRRQVAVFARSSPAPVSSVAAPVRDGLGQTLAAVSVVVPAGAAPPQAYVPVVRATALAVARGLGHRPPRTG
ncbi:IclR family transcriptional regulator [Actinomycetospora sp. TBRC 11914]|uniref:IclR family transcriptional regulator n=1 Tax=Actinomycetospora sp. TBRC 11914 TaxID=2729387 RepID=UPI002007151F|nr:IclR family transcriptional regulator [Actinomycetospora sp. TBRC 11914]